MVCVERQDTLDSPILFVFFLRNQFAKMINIFAKFWYKTNRYPSIVIVTVEHQKWNLPWSWVWPWPGPMRLNWKILPTWREGRNNLCLAWIILNSKLEGLVSRNGTQNYSSYPRAPSPPRSPPPLIVSIWTPGQEMICTGLAAREGREGVDSVLQVYEWNKSKETDVRF